MAFDELDLESALVEIRGEVGKDHHEFAGPTWFDSKLADRDRHLPLGLGIYAIEVCVRGNGAQLILSNFHTHPSLFAFDDACQGPGYRHYAWHR